MAVYVKPLYCLDHEFIAHTDVLHKKLTSVKTTVNISILSLRILDEFCSLSAAIFHNTNHLVLGLYY